MSTQAKSMSEISRGDSVAAHRIVDARKNSYRRWISHWCRSRVRWKLSSRGITTKHSLRAQ